MLNLVLAAAALALEAALGYPKPLYSAIGHPVTWIGRAISALDRALNREEASPGMRRAAGIGALLVLILACFALAWALESILRQSWAGLAVLAVLAASLPAQRSLHDHVRSVADALDRDGADEGRRAVSLIVGRNTDELDEAGVARAAIESLAENFSDGVVAPAFWIVVGGLTGGVVYKAVNTADSMIGHRTPRHETFGWGAARFDDLVNLPASRLSAVWLLLAACVTTGASAKGAWRAVWRDASRHRSPNAGWPEAAMAGALGLALGGKRTYGQTRVDDAQMGDGRRDAGAADIRAALQLYRTACLIQWITLAALAALLSARA